MSLREKKKIAIFACDLTNEYQKKLVQGLFECAAADGYYSVCYSFFFNFDGNYDCEKGERMLAQLPKYDEYDGIFLCLDTFGDAMLCADIFKRVKSRAACPVVSIRRECGDYNCVLIKDDDSMRSVIMHLIGVHAVQDVFYVSGPKDHPDAIKRLNCTRKVLSENGITLDDRSIVYGNFWRNMGREIVDTILERRNGQLPEAIVCANDYMAISVCNELSNRLYKIPEDVIVTGFDDVDEAELIFPSMTSVKIDVDRMAVKSWEMLRALINHENVNDNEYVSTSVVPRGSCGCREESVDFISGISSRKYDQFMRMKVESFEQAMMNMDASKGLTIEELGRIIERYFGLVIDGVDFVTVLNDFNWADVDEETMRGFTDKMQARIPVINKHLINNVSYTIDSGDLIPTELLYEKPCGYFVLPLHYQERSYGYAMVRFENNGGITDFLRFLIIAVSNALESIRSAYKINGLVDRLSKMYVTDAMTGLKNRHGFDEESVKMFAVSQRERRRLAIIGIDMDGLKSINDTFGHAEGDCAIKALAEAIKFACDGDEQGYRVGGDEFQVLAMNYSDDNVKRFLDKLLSYLVEFNARSQKPYNVRCSHGYAICVPDAGKKLNEWMTLSDNRMYEMKEGNRKTRKIIR